MVEYKHKIDAGHPEDGLGNTIMEALTDARVVKAIVKDGMVEFREQCDDYYSARLTPEQVRLLAQELEDLARTAEGDDDDQHSR